MEQTNSKTIADYKNDIDKPIKVVQSRVCLKIYPYISHEYSVAISITMIM